MTVLDDRPRAQPGLLGRVEDTPRSASSLSSWRLASRLARRDVRRRPGRTLLVMLLVAVPVIAMTAASLVARTSAETSEESFAREFGRADLVIAATSVAGSGAPGPDLPPFAPGTETLEFLEADTTVRAMVDGVVTAPWTRLLDLDLTDPIASGMVEVTSGRVPAGSGEVLLAPRLADQLGVAVGDRLELVRPDLDLLVVGFGEDQSWTANTLMVAPGLDRSIFRPDRVTVRTLVDLPESMTPAAEDSLTRELSAAGLGVGSPQSWSNGDEGVDGRALAWGWVAGVLAFVGVGIVIAAAFATSARRHLVTVGQLSANGASPRVVRRNMALQGSWTGLFGAVLGIVIGVVGGIVAHRNEVFDRFSGRPPGPLDVAPVDLLVIVVTAVVAATAAASVPARSAARIPVLSALAGRRPVGNPPRWLAPVGVAIFLAGLLLLAAAASVDNGGDLIAAVAVIGGLGVMFGMVCASPLVVAGAAAVGARLGGPVRLAARSLGRSRLRSAGVLTAIAVVGAAATIASVAVSNARQSDERNDLDARTVEVFHVSGFFDDGPREPVGVIDDPPTFAPELPVELRDQIEAIVPGAEWTPIRRVVFDPPGYDADTGRPVDPAATEAATAVVADAEVVDLAAFDDDQLAELAATGVLVTSPWIGDRVDIATLGDPISVDVSGSTDLLGVSPDADQAELDAFFRVQTNAQRIADVFVSPDFVEENGLSTTVGSYRITAPAEITRAQSNALNEMQAFFRDDAFVASASAPGSPFAELDDREPWIASAWFRGPPVPWGLIQLGVLVASLLAVLAVVAIGLSLAAAESRDERDVLRAVGAAPSTLRRAAATKAWVLTTGAACVAVPVGYVTVFVITKAMGDANMTASFPILVAGALLLMIPASAWLATLATSAVAQRLRPPTATPAD